MELLRTAISRIMRIGEALEEAVKLYGEFGTEAANVASERANHCMVQADGNGFRAWNLVCAMIKQIEARSKRDLATTGS